MVSNDPQSPGNPPPGPPPEFLENQMLAQAVMRTQLFGAAAELGVADVLADGPKTAAELAEATATHEPSLRRVMRALISLGVFTQDDSGRYALNPRGDLLRSDHPKSQRAMGRFYRSKDVWDAWGALLDGLHTGNTPFELVHGTSHFDYMATRPEVAAIFNEFMSSLPVGASALAYDYSAAEVVVDVGGGHGNSLLPVLKAYPNVRGILFDQPHVVESARPVVASSGMADRCELVGGSFFEALPAGGDVYILGNILHDWNDEDCGRILAACRNAAKAESRLLVVETLVPPGNEPSPAKMLDIGMLVMLGGLQRTEQEYRDLLARSSFSVDRVIPAGPTSIVEAKPT